MQVVNYCFALTMSHRRLVTQTVVMPWPNMLMRGDVAKRDTPIPNQHGTLVYQSVTYITEGGVYSLIFGSKQERAKEFKRWVTGEVSRLRPSHPRIRPKNRVKSRRPTTYRQQGNNANITLSHSRLSSLSRLSYLFCLSSLHDPPYPHPKPIISVNVCY